MSIEKKTAEAVLQKPMQVNIGGKDYIVAPPSIATLIMASEKIAELPTVELKNANLVYEAFAIAPQCRAIADIIAVFILGARVINNEKRPNWICRLFGAKDSRYKSLSKEIAENATPHELNDMFSKLLMRMDIGDFFALTTSLIGVNLTKAKKTETSPTQYGQ